MLQFLDEVVEPTIRDFEADPTSRRRAFLACAATFHAIDYLAYPSKSAAIRSKLQAASKTLRPSIALPMRSSMS